VENDTSALFQEVSAYAETYTPGRTSDPYGPVLHAERAEGTHY